jgi:predicted esterase
MVTFLLRANQLEEVDFARALAQSGVRVLLSAGKNDCAKTVLMERAAERLTKPGSRCWPTVGCVP